MTDVVCKSDAVTESKEISGEGDLNRSANNVTSDTSNRSKLKDRSRKSKTSSALAKTHSSSRPSRKSRSTPKMGDKKESRDSGERRSSSENQSTHSLLTHIKEEAPSDDQHSSVSENRSVLLTRARIRRIERRKAYSSNSSAIESDNRKAKSEPIIITLDSDSDDNVSFVSNRPNRSARIRGEIIRKLSRTATKNTSYKTCYSSSSSEYDNVRQKKKPKSKSVKTSSSSQVAKRKKYLVNHLGCKRKLKLKKHEKTRITHVYRPKLQLRQTRVARSLRKQLEKKKERQNSKASSVPARRSCSQKPGFVERRTLRSTSTDTAVGNAVKVELLTDSQKIDKNTEVLKTQSDITKSHEGKKTSEILNSKKNTKKEPKITPLETKVVDEKIIKSESAINKSKEPTLGANIEQVLNPSIVEPVLDAKMEAVPDTSTQLEAGVRKEPTKIITDNEIGEQATNINLESKTNSHIEPGPDINMESKEIAPKDESKAIASTSGHEVKKNTEKGSSSINQSLEKMKKIKKKIKPADKILRKRGRPRLSEMKPVREIPNLNDMIQIPFLQSSFCFTVASKLPKCRECRIAVNRCNRSMLHSYCRFMEYRKLCYSKNGTILNAGFSEPSDATAEHLNQWLPLFDDPPKDLNCNTSKALLEHIGDQFCDLIEQEKEALSLHIGRDRVITWKRIVSGVREMCDVCYTTLFNIHWVCPICGLAVCIDCYKGRKQGITVEYDEGQPKNRDQYNWLLCTLRQPHDPEKLIMAQIIPGSALWTMRDLLHKARKKWNIPSYCKCNPQSISSSDKYISTGICKQLMCYVTKSFSTERSNLYYNNDSNMHNGDNNYDDLDIEVSGTALKWLEGSVGDINSGSLKPSDDYINSYEDFASLRGNLLNGEDNSSGSEREISSFSLDDIIACVTNPQNGDNKENSGKSVVKHFSSRYPHPNSGRDPLPIRIYTKLESNLSFSEVPHSWLCNGRLLFLLQSGHANNLALFQEQWKRGQPILVKGVDENLSKELWHPDAFCRDFGEVRNDLVDCRTGAIIRNLPMRRFWEGFESFNKRLKDDNGEFMLLKLKDWPPGEDFSEMLPRRFHDLMNGLPLPEYTHRDGILNLAGRLPLCFVRPDLGPKMYNAYGSALYPTKGTTNLHLDVSDAVNVMVYVGIPQDGNAQLHIEEALKAIDEGGCDSLMRARVRARGAKPGALWHIYNARDADKIRELLNKVAIERGEKLEAHHDPIHDQSWYLDAELRKRLYRDYGVEGYAIAQCLGDAVFIPAGAPHQVRNLHSCVKVAEDFVSPENIAHCFKLTQEFRHLSDTHTNHEDKLQIKNIIYHVVRDALSHLLSGMDAAES